MSKVKDETGNVYGELTVLKKDESKKPGVAYWICKCSCGKTTSVCGACLRNGTTKSCGHLRSIKDPPWIMHSDIIGKRYGRLIVKEITGTNGDNYRAVCLCDCGKTKSINLYSLKGGKVNSCGCMRTEVIQKICTKDLTGQVFGRLTVLKKSETSPRKWICRCECGTVKEISSNGLLNNNTRSCGCYLKEYLKEHSAIDMTNQKFGMLTVLKRDGTEFSRNGASKYATWLCKCECGTIKSIRGTYLRFGLLSCGCLASKGEYQIRKLLNKKDVNFDTQYSFSDLIGPKGGTLLFDFAILNKNNKLECLIEYQGIQHYRNTGDFGRYEREVTDPIKKDYCKTHNIRLYEIPYNKDIETELNKILLETSYANTVPSSAIEKV